MSSVAARSVDGDLTQISVSALDGLGARLRGRLLLAAHPDYESARSVWNAMIDRRPAVIVRPLGAADVATSIAFARAHRIPIAIKGGAHNIAGLAACDGGLMLDMSLMRGVWVDHAERRAGAQAGCLLGDVDRETQLHGLAAVLGFVSNTGIAGLTLGGGFGYLTRRFGWTSDNVCSIQLVTADGRLVRASADEHPDLFWGLCGGGGNFGVVTHFEYVLHEIGPDIVGGAIAWRIDEAPRVLETFRELTSDAPPEVTCVAALRRAPPAPWLDESVHGQSMVALFVCHTGPVEQGEQWVRRLTALGSPVGDTLQRRPYVSQQSLLDATQPAGRRYYWKSEYLAGHDPGLLESAVEHASRVESPHSAILLFPLDGPLNDVPDEHSAVGNRDARSVVNIAASWESSDDDAGNIEWARAAWEDLRQYSTGGTYVNFLAGDEPDDRVRSAYGGNYTRLVEVKRQWDPDNVFRVNKNIRP